VEDARKLFERINTELPDTPSHKFALFYLAKIYLEKGEHNKAMDVYKKLTKVCKEDAFLFLAKERLARLAMDEGKYELALSLYRELLKMPHPPLRTPHLKLCVGRCIQHLNEEEAIKYYTSFIKEYKESEYARYAAAFLSQIRKGR
jgi:tetratricopeptide (TPR) repeat protein